MDQSQISDVSENPILTSQPKAPLLRRHDNIFVLLSFIVGFAFCEFVLFGGFGIGVPLFYAFFYPVAAIFLSREHNIFSKPAVLSFLPVLTLLLCFVLFDNSLLRMFNVIALWICTTFNLLTMAELENCPIFWAGTWFDILKTTFYTPFHHLGKCITAFTGSYKISNRRNIGIVLLTLLVISPVVLIVLILLSNSDAGFATMLAKLNKFSTAEFWSYVFKIILSVLIAFPLFNLLFALRQQKRPEEHPIEGFILKLSFLNQLATTSALSVFSLIYVLYIALQMDYFFSAMRGILPSSFTYAEYARRGFFELVSVVFINFGMIALAVTLTKRKKGRLLKSCRISVLALVICTILLIITAVSKMVMYMKEYGLTPLRVYTSWFMLLLGVLAMFTVLKMIMPNFNFYKFAAVGAISLYLALNVINVDSLIAHYNISLYQQNGKLDTQVFYELSDSAISEIANLKDDVHYGAQIRKLLNSRKAQLTSNNWQSFSFAQIAARQAISSAS